MYERHVDISGVTAVSGKLLAGINSNYGDTAKFTSSTASDVKEICEEFEGNDNGDEPTSISTGPSDVSLDYSFFFIRPSLKNPLRPASTRRARTSRRSKRPLHR